MESSNGTIYQQPTEVNKNIQKLQNVTNASNRVLFKASTLFPFDFFPDTIIIHDVKIDIIHTLFFATTKVVSFPISSLINVTASTNSFFGVLNLEMVGFEPNPGTLKFLSIHDAIRARRILNGLIICYKENVDLTKLDINLVKQKVEEIGTT